MAANDASASNAKALLSRLAVAAFLMFVAGFWAMQVQEQHARPVRKRVRFWHMWTAEWKDVVDKIVDRFNKSQDEYEVEALSVPSQGADSKFILGVMGGDPPDVMAQWNPVIPPWAEDNLLTPLDTLMTPEELRTFNAQAYPSVKKLGTYKGRLYGMSIGINMTAIYYLPQQFRDAGLDPDHLPNTLEGLTAEGDKLNRFDPQGNLTRLGWNPHDIQCFVPLFGGQFYDWKTGRLTIDTPQNEAALSYLADASKRVGHEKMIRFLSGLNVNSAAGGWPFIDGAFSMAEDGQWRVEQLRKYAPNLEYRTAPIPPPKGGVQLAGHSSGNFMVVPRDAKNQKGAWAFIRYWSGLTDPDTAAEFYTWGGWLPLTPAVANAPAYRDYIKKYPQFQTFVDLMPSDHIDTLAPVPYQEFLSDQIIKMEDAVVRGTVSAKDALVRLQQTVDAEKDRRKELGYDR